MLRHAPQLFSSVFSSTQTPPQLLWPALQQMPFALILPDAQQMPPVLSVPGPQQMPLELCWVAVQQMPLVFCVPLAQQMPLEQVLEVAVQSAPPAPTQPPQSTLLVSGFWHVPPQLRSAAELQQMPITLN